MIDRDEPVFRDFKPQARLAFERFHRANPRVFQAFKAQARKMKAEGRKRYSGQNIVEKMRWDYPIQTDRKPGDFKLNNNHVAIYARLLIHRYPKEFVGFFILRKIGARSSFSDAELERYATGLDEDDDL